MITIRSLLLYFVSLVVSLAYVSPFLALGDVNIYLSEFILYLSIVLIMMTKFKLDLGIFISFSVLVVLGCIHSILNGVILDMIIPLRYLCLFYFSFILAKSLNKKEINFIFPLSLLTICGIYTVYSIPVVFKILSRELTVLNFLYDYDAGRIRVFFENGTTSVVLGYLLSLLFAIVLCSSSIKGRKVLLLLLFCLGILTASRANILSNLSTIIVYQLLSKSDYRLSWYGKMLMIFILVGIGTYIILLKMILANTQIDGSTSIRLRYYLIAINSAETVFDLWFGHGFSEESLFRKFTISFFESYFFNTYVSGGILGLISCTLILCRTFYLFGLTGRKYFTILSGVLIGNMLGGANFFSIFTMGFMMLGLRFLELNDLYKRK